MSENAYHIPVLLNRSIEGLNINPDGIYADLTLRYEKGNYFPFPWSFPDFKEGHYNKMLLRIRELYKQQRKNKQ